MDEAARAQEVWSQLTGRTLETMTVWADANQRMLKEWVEFTSGAAVTVMENAGSAAVDVPSVAQITIFASVPTSPLDGVPVRAPVPVLNCAQGGGFWIENVTGPLGAVIVGRKL